MYCPRCGKDARRWDRDPRYIVCDNCRKKFYRPIEDDYEIDGTPAPEDRPVIREKRSICTIIALILTLAYLAYSAYYWQSSSTQVSDLAGQLGFAIAKTAVMPHLIAVAIGFVFNAVGVILPNRWFVLVAAIIYCVALFLFLPYFMFVLLQIILSFVGFGLMVSYRNKQKHA